MSNQIKILNGDDRDMIRRLFGRSIEECIEGLNLLDAIKQKEHKMTREEAVKKIEMTANKGYDAIPAKQLVDGLEALGLIKFEEDNNPLLDIGEYGKIKRFYLGYLLLKQGYKIVKVGDAA